MPEYDITQIIAPDGTICNIRDKNLSLLNEQLEDILETGGEPVLISKTITENGTYRALDDNANGYREVTVDVPTSAETFAFLFVTTNTGATITVSKGTTTLPSQTSTGDELLFHIPEAGTWTVTAEKTGETTITETVSITTTDVYTLNMFFIHIYGVSWDKSSSTALTRTDNAVGFSDPNPYYAGMSGEPSSPFDNLMPWSGMTKETIDGNVLVKIPKFWYKWTSTSSTLKLQIADKALAGFHVSPAHADRGDGKGERDYVYIARYKCSSTDYKSVTGKSPKVYITRDAARTAIKALGTGFYQQDFAMFWTTRMLYLVEYANWNSQATIGYGCGNNRSVQNTGASDSMTYHTGTMQSARTTYGVGVQYRWIEDPWGNVREWCDGIYFSGSKVYCINNPANFSDTTGGTEVGTRSTTDGYISDWSIPTATGFEYALYPSAVSGGEQTYIADYCGYDSSGVTLGVGGNYYQYQSYGMFYLEGYDTAPVSHGSLGARLQYLP